MLSNLSFGSAAKCAARIVALLLVLSLTHGTQEAMAKKARVNELEQRAEEEAKLQMEGKIPPPSPEGQEGTPELQPDTIEYGRMQVGKKDFLGALRTYKTIFLARPYDADVLLGMAYCYEQLGNLDQALIYGRQATMAAPDRAEVHVALGHYLEGNRDLKAAYLQYSRALDLKPTRPVMEQIWGPTLRLLMGLNDMPIALRLAQEWAHKFPKDATCQYNNGWVLSMAGGDKKFPDAISAYQEAVRLDPGLTGAHYNLALLHYKLGDNNAAVTEAEQFIKLAPNDSDIPKAKALYAKLKAAGATPITFSPDYKRAAKDALKKQYRPVEIFSSTPPPKTVTPPTVPQVTPQASTAKSAAPAPTASPVATSPVTPAQPAKAEKRSKWDELHSK